MEEEKISKEVEYKQLNLTIRHYSNLRFLIMPIFFAVNGGIFIATQNDKAHIPAIMYLALVLLAAAICAVFGQLEWNLNKYMEAFVSRIKKLEPNGFWSRRPETHNRVTRSIIFLYCIVVGCWGALAIVKLIEDAPPVCPN
jgi:hypothetical protein